MSDIRHFRHTSDGTTELTGKAVAIEKTLQKLIESQMIWKSCFGSWLTSKKQKA